MKGKEYIKTQMAIVKLGREVSQLDLDAFVRSINNAETLAPMLDPTLFKKAQANMSALKELAQALNAVKTTFSRLEEEVLKTSMAYFARGEKQPGLPSTDDEAPPKGLPV